MEALSFPELNPTRAKVRSALVKLSKGRINKARDTLELSPGQDAEIERNKQLDAARALPASEVYSGVLFAALDYGSLTSAAKRRADNSLIVTSALFGAVRLNDEIPAYRLSGSVALPGVGAVAAAWRKALDPAMPAIVNDDVVFDLRSGTYAKFWQPDAQLAEQTAVGRVLQRRPDGSVKVVSHHNKATKGRLVRALVSQRSQPRSVDALASLLVNLGYEIDLAPQKPGKPTTIDIIVSQL